MVTCWCASTFCMSPQQKETELQFLNEVEPSTLKASRNGKRVLGPVYRNAMYPGHEDGWKRCTTTLYELFLESVEKYSTNYMLGYRPGKYPDVKPYKYFTYSQVHERVKALAGAFSKRVSRGTSVGVYSASCVEWQLTIQITNRLALKCVPLDNTLGADQILYMINHAEVRVIAVQSEYLPNLAKVVGKITSSVKLVMYWGDAPGATTAQKLRDAAIEVVSVEQLEREGAGMNIEDPPTPDDICAIQYTSGTTGKPKGVLLTHSNVLASMTAFVTKLHDEHINMYENTRYMSHISPANAYGRISEDAIVSLGGVIGYWSGNVLGLLDDAQAFQPTYWAGFPRMFDCMRTRGLATLSNHAVKRLLFSSAARYKTGQLNAGKDPKKAGGMWDKVVFKKTAAMFGSNLELVLAGGAPLAPHTEEFVRLATCTPLSIGYGMSETCFSGCMVNAREPAQAGSVGVPLPGMQVRLAAVPEMGYDPLGTPARGEVLLKGPQVFQGYHKMADKTREVLTEDGWFQTGDVGEWSPCGTLKIIDRLGNIIKLAQGWHVEVERLEAAYKKDRFVDQIWVYGSQFETCLVAIVVPVHDTLLHWARANKRRGQQLQQLCNDSEVTSHVLKSICATGKQQNLQHHELVRAIKLAPEAFSVEKGLLSSPQVLKRQELLKRFQGDLDLMYIELELLCGVEWSKTSPHKYNLLVEAHR